MNIRKLQMCLLHIELGIIKTIKCCEQKTVKLNSISRSAIYIVYKINASFEITVDAVDHQQEIIVPCTCA